MSSALPGDSNDRKPLPGWRALNMDTAAWAEEIQFEFFRDAPAWRKLQMSAQLTSDMLNLAEVGLRDRHPEASTQEIRRRLADMVLGEELALAVYGPLEQ